MQLSQAFNVILQYDTLRHLLSISAVILDTELIARSLEEAGNRPFVAPRAVYATARRRNASQA